MYAHHVTINLLTKFHISDTPQTPPKTPSSAPPHNPHKLYHNHVRAAIKPVTRSHVRQEEEQELVVVVVVT